MRHAQVGDTVRVHYTGKLQDGQVFDSSEGQDTLEFTLGTVDVIRGFHQAVIGMTRESLRQSGSPVTSHMAHTKKRFVSELMARCSELKG